MMYVWEFIADNWKSGIEILLLAIGLYYVYINLRRTAGAYIFIGLGTVVLTLLLISQLLNLEVINSVLRYSAFGFAILLIVIFQPELRRIFTRLGTHHLWGASTETRETVEEIVDTAYALSARGFGALIAIERDITLDPWVETGVLLNANFSKELALTIFHPKTVLHDGAIIIRDDRISAASCIFPLTQREDIDRHLGLRHRAALGLTEECDAIAIIVSEENGHVSICHRGKLERHLSPDEFRAQLHKLLFNELPEENIPA